MIIDNQKKQIRELFESDKKYVQNEDKIQNEFIVQMQVAKYDQKNKDDPLLISAGLTQQKQSVFIIQGKLQNDNNIKSITYYMISLLQNQKNQQSFHNMIQRIFHHLSQYRIEIFLASIDIQISNLCFIQYFLLVIIIDQFCLSISQKFHQSIYFQLEQYNEKSLLLYRNFTQSLKNFLASILKTSKKYLSYMGIFSQNHGFGFKRVFKYKIAELLNYQFFQRQQFEKMPSYCKDSSYQQLQQAFAGNQQFIIQSNQNQIYNIELDQYEITSKGIPLILDLCITKLLQNPANIRLEGIFRLCSAQTHDKEFENYLIQKQYSEILDYENIIVIANFIKRVLDKLKYSVFPYQYYNQINTLNHYSIKEVQLLIQQFPQLNRNLFTLIILILKSVAQQSDFNKMGASNLAIVFGISLCRPQEYEEENVQEQYQKIKIVNSFIQFIIENASQIFPNQKINDFLLETLVEQNNIQQEERQKQ